MSAAATALLGDGDGSVGRRPSGAGSTIGSVRKQEDIEETVSAGAHVATTTPKVDAALEGATPRPIFMAMLFDLIKKRHV